ncbi:DUF1822 domain-containing protein [Fischerella thermalis CCMEE 5273]|uniref:DUF1822 domain-containing protein n=3 Tax=Hapalosiphonaceae TaxID=1892263 RepID=A0A2N6JU54_FISMU|nr:hypothetical protein CBP17_18875 [Fischerella thermalis WC114]PLZ06963.1 hypothetical protein CBP18_18675 [Fischerella thermalis WC119]PLZ14797.1 hypothetical protein CBP19_07700 [Fischerella thermalis WC1110]PLZ22168.1 hypothetical protein CBP30_06410 [Fischerella thermalis WC157]PLZ24726.1 hypothetical protein CBP29_10025 [Fischerella thermalis WC341]PLZ29857.1 hypothetical protein CBP28_08990 [Fischerella thermalis WC559]PLZ31743.1 hypothetical protein CBP10_10960 [Fischerella thermalis
MKNMSNKKGINHLTLEASEEAFEYLQALLKSGELSELLGVSVLDVREIPITETKALNQIKQPENVNLRQWFAGMVEAGWLAIEQLLDPQQVELAFGFRNAISIVRAQKIDLGMQLARESVALVVILPPEADEEVDIVVQVHPLGQTHLPQGVQLLVSDKSGNQLEARSREADNFIQLEFSAKDGESFSVTVILKEVRVTQEFII